jgi:tRNA-uridine 2-sulfurtransferase
MKKKQNKKVIVAMSGGVDSGMTAYLLKQQGYEVMGVFFRLTDNYIASESAARAICRFLDIKFYPVNLTREFKKEIINYFIKSYECGQTPNPCVKCNQFIKFQHLLRVMREFKADFVATGHYLKKKEIKRGKNISYKLFCGDDEKKDQTYFLYNLTQSQLKHIFFPLGKYFKKDIQAMADKIKLPNIKQESQDICFMNIDGIIIEHNDYLKKYIKAKPGKILTLNGEKIGKHQGLPFHTIGQRRGVEIGGKGPYYAAKMDYKKNILYVANDVNDPTLFGDSLIAKDVNWINGEEPKLPLQCEAVIRYRHKPAKCTIEKATKQADKRLSACRFQYKVKFSEPQRAITAGQSVVFYQGNELLGGGVIS